MIDTVVINYVYHLKKKNLFYKNYFVIYQSHVTKCNLQVIYIFMCKFETTAKNKLLTGYTINEIYLFNK